MMKIWGIGVSLALLGSVCSADVVDFSVSDPFSTANGSASANFDALGLMLTARPQGSTLTWTAGSGFGITFGGQLLDEIDEIDYPEMLRVQFLVPTAVNSFTVSNMYLNEGVLGLNDERGLYSIDNGQTWVSFQGAVSGEATIGVGGVAVDSIWFTVDSTDALFDEYSLKKLNVTRVPEGPSVALLSVIACCVLLALRRRACPTA